MSVFVSCGEVSGDLYASSFVRELQELEPSLKGRIWGMMGPLTREALSPEPEGGAADKFPAWCYDELKLIGLVEVLSALPRVLRLRRTIADEIIRINPEAVVVIDSPDFHLGLVKKLRAMGYKGKAVCLVTPTVWAWRSSRTEILKEYFDLCLPLFSFEHKFLVERGVNSRWLSHPLAIDMAGFSAPAELTERFAGERLIAIMPGSRGNELRYNLDRLVKTAGLLKSEGFTPAFSVAPGSSAHFKEELKGKISGFDFWEGPGRELMAASCAVVAVSGTVSVEAMLLRRYAVVVCDANPLSLFIARRLVRTPYVSIPNLLADEQIYPEFIGASYRAEQVVEKLHIYLDDPDMRERLDALMEKAGLAMGTENSPQFWAKETLALI